MTLSISIRAYNVTLMRTTFRALRGTASSIKINYKCYFLNIDVNDVDTISCIHRSHRDAHDVDDVK